MNITYTHSWYVMRIGYFFLNNPPQCFCLYHVNYRFNYSISQEICTRFFALLCFVVVIHWLIFPYPSGLHHWHWGNLTIAPVPAKQPWWIWINTSYEFIMNDCITTTKQSTTKPCAYFLGYTVGIMYFDYVDLNFSSKGSTGIKQG